MSGIGKFLNALHRSERREAGEPREPGEPPTMTDWCIVVISNVAHDQQHLFIGACQHPVGRLHELRKLIAPGANTRLIIQATVAGLERASAVKIEDRVHEMLRTMRVRCATDGTGLKWYAVSLEQMRAAVVKAKQEVTGVIGEPRPSQSQQAQPAQPSQPSRPQQISETSLQPPQDRKPLPIYVTDGPRPALHDIEPGFVLDLDEWMRS